MERGRRLRLLLLRPIVRTPRFVRRKRNKCSECSGLVGAVGIEPLSPVQTRKLFILRSDKNPKNDRNAEVRYTAGTQSPPSLGRGFDSHRRSIKGSGNFGVADRQLLEVVDEHDVARRVIHLRISQPFPIGR
jgi:hypothetical protein